MATEGSQQRELQEKSIKARKHELFVGEADDVGPRKTFRQVLSETPAAPMTKNVKMILLGVIAGSSPVRRRAADAAGEHLPRQGTRGSDHRDPGAARYPDRQGNQRPAGRPPGGRGEAGAQGAAGGSTETGREEGQEEEGQEQAQEQPPRRRRKHRAEQGR